MSAHLFNIMVTQARDPISQLLPMHAPIAHTGTHPRLISSGIFQKNHETELMSR
jgi:hypothetical protein